MLEGALGTAAVRDERTGGHRRGLATREPRRRDTAAWLSAVSLVGKGRPRGMDAATGGEAAAVVQDWLALVDDGRYALSRMVAAPELRDGVSAHDWETAVRAVRRPLGRCLSRKLRARAAREAPPGGPGGRWAVLRFQGRFERRPDVVETVTASRGADGRWRVAAYFVG